MWGTCVDGRCNGLINGTLAWKMALSRGVFEGSAFWYFVVMLDCRLNLICGGIYVQYLHVFFFSICTYLVLTCECMNYDLKRNK